MRAFVLGRVETESRGIIREREVIIDRLGDVDVVDRIVLGLKEFGDPVGGGGGVVATDSYQELHIVVLEKSQVEILLEILVGRLETAHLEIGSSPVEIGVRLEEVDVLVARVLVEQAAVALMESNDSETVGKECLGH